MALPSAKHLAGIVRAKRVEGQSVAASESYLLAHRNKLVGYSDVEEMVLSAEFDTSRELGACEFHLITLRRAVARELWERDIFVGISVLDALLFRALVQDASPDPMLATIEYIRDFGLGRPGLALYPLHSLGVLGAGFAQTFARSYPTFVHEGHGLVLTPQTNSLERTLKFLSEAARELGVRQSVPEDLVSHWHRSRSARWLERNPLLALRVRSFPGTYYENQYFLIVKLNLAKTFVLMLASMEPRQPDTNLGVLTSSARTNNFQTLDIKHYFLFYPRAGRAGTMAGDCVPMNGVAATLAEISSLPIELDPRHWRRRPLVASRISLALFSLERAYLTGTLRSRQNSLRARVARKLYRSLDFYRRSFRRSDSAADSTINLAIAFEVLLTDNYAPGIEAKINKRLRLALAGVRGMRKLQGSVSGLYQARSAFAHSGDSTAQVDLPGAQETFVHAFLRIVERLPHLPNTSAQPIGHLLNDVAK